MSSKEKQLFDTVTWKTGKDHSPEEPRMLHVLRIFIVRFLRTNANPEEVLWLLPLINHLRDTLINGAVTAFQQQAAKLELYIKKGQLNNFKASLQRDR